MASKKDHQDSPRRQRGTGSIFESPKGSGIWWAGETIEGRYTRRRGPSKQAAEAKLAELQKFKQKRVDVHSGMQTYEEWLNTCHKEKQRLNDLKPRSVEFNRDMMERYIVPKMGAMRLLDIRPTHIQSFVDTLYAEIRAAHMNEATGKPIHDGARTVHACATIIRETLTLAYERRLILDNPYSGIRLPKMRRKEVVPLDDEQVRALMAAARGELDRRPTYKTANGRVKRQPAISPRLRALWACYLLLGWRRGEGLASRWMAIDWKRGTITIEEQIQRLGSTDGVALFTGTPKTESGVRTLPLPRRLLVWLGERWDEAQSERTLLDADWHEHGLIFPSEVGTPMWPDNLDAMFRRLRAAAGLPDTIKLHHLRHTLATLLDECGATEALKAGILGHAKQDVTQRYTHARLEAMRRVLQAVEDRLFGDVVTMEETGT
jgi:integrase